jgi:hypothetical protein
VVVVVVVVVAAAAAIVGVGVEGAGEGPPIMEEGGMWCWGAVGIAMIAGSTGRLEGGGVGEVEGASLTWMSLMSAPRKMI